MAGRRGQIVKLMRPRTASAVSRARLFQMLDRARHHHVVWLCAPPGAGKTTLVASYIATKKLAALWYTLDPADGDLATLFHFLAKAAPDRGEPLPALTADRRASLAVFARQFFDRLCARLPKRALLVFDDFHEVPEAAGLGELLRIAIASLREGQRIVVLSRTPPPADLAASEIAGKLVQIGAADLRLTLAEAASLARKRRATLRQHTLQTLHARTQGWVAGLVCFLETGVVTETEMPAVLRDFLERELLVQLPAATRDMLVRLALPRRLSEATATALGGARACSTLDELARRGSFVFRRAAASWELHPLFRELLLERGVRELAPEELARVRTIAAARCVADGEIDDAAELHADGGDWNALASLACEVAPAMLAQGREATLERWFARLPHEVRARPWLELWQGQCRLHRDPVSACAHFTRAFDGFRVAGDRAGQLAAWPGVVMAMVASSDDLRPVDRWIAALEELDTTAGAAIDEAAPTLLASLLFAINMRAPGHPRAQRWIASAMRQLETGAPDPGIVMLGGQLIEYGLLFGDPATARRALARMQRFPAAAVQSSLALGHAESLCALQNADLVRARECAEAAIAMAAGAGIPRTLLHATAARATLVAGALDAARHHIAEMLDGAPPASRLHTAHHAYLDGWESLLAGEHERAIDRSSRAARLSAEIGAVFPEGHCRLLLAESLVEAGMLDAARTELARVAEIGAMTNSRALLAQAHATTAHASLVAGEHERALTAAGAAFSVAREVGISPLVMWPARREAVAALCTAAIDAEIEPDIACELVRLRVGDFAPPPSLDRWPWPVRVRLCGGFALELDGKATSAQRKVQHRPLELLQLLVALGGQNIPESLICDAMWPDADGDRAEKTFEITLHRLRSLLGDPTFVRREAGKVTLDRSRMFADVWAIDELVRQVLAVKKPDSHVARRRLARASALHVGPVLPDSSASWAARTRADLAAKLARAGAAIR